MPLRAVLFDVDFTIAKPGPDLGPEGYRRLGERFGLALEPESYDEARRRAAEAAMVGDSVEDDVEGAKAVGMRAILLDRENRYPDVTEKLTDLRALPAA